MLSDCIQPIWINRQLNLKTPLGKCPVGVDQNIMDINIFGLGYVGVVSAACLAKEGHKVTGVDPNVTKIALINAGKTPIIEKDVGELISNAVNAKLLRATTSIEDAIASTSVSLICVGTPNQLNGSLNLKFVRGVCEDIGLTLVNLNPV
jgi:GDP-mannose 6-dehydrogenase